VLVSDEDKFREFLTKTAEALDIPDHVYEDATLKYEDIGAWLAAEDSELRSSSPEIYPQGSFRLGTVVRPVSEKDEYDIDLVCHLELNKEQTTQKTLKQIVGDRLKKRPDLARIVEPLRRCWRLDYPPENQMPRFHMDVLPSIPNRDRPPTGILLTDTELTRWQSSNPKAYADWFYERMKAIFSFQKAQLAKSFQGDVEEVPEWQVKTPLQRAIQILKRHRDIHFQTSLDDRPVSIIITTLGALAYNNQANAYDTLIDILRDMPRFIQNRNGQWWVVNPVDPNENFADKWNEIPKRREAFGRWLKKAREDFSSANQMQTVSRALDYLTPVLGLRAVTKAAKDLGLKLTSTYTLPATYQIQIPALGDTQHCLAVAWPIEPHYKVSVSGSVHHKEKSKKLWQLSDRPVAKQVSLRFTASTNAPQPYEVKWQVVNTGKEAAEAEPGQLRGGFYDSEPPTSGVRWERTKYSGTHWVEAFIIKNGVCVARSGRKFVKIR